MSSIYENSQLSLGRIVSIGSHPYQWFLVFIMVSIQFNVSYSVWDKAKQKQNLIWRVQFFKSLLCFLGDFCFVLFCYILCFDLVFDASFLAHFSPLIFIIPCSCSLAAQGKYFFTMLVFVLCVHASSQYPTTKTFLNSQVLPVPCDLCSLF